MPEIYKASLRQMAVPFKIPKKKQASDSCSINMLSPLSRLQDSSSDKAQWSSVTHNGKIAHKTSSVNGNMFSKHNQRNESVGPIGPALTKSQKLHAERCGERQDLSPETCAPGRVTRICSDSTPKGPKHGKICFKLNEHPIKYSPARVNGAPSLVTGTPGSQTKSQTSSTGTVFSGNIRWRPKRASDTLCHDENHKGACESPSLKIRRATDLGQTEECGSFDEEEEEEMEETQRLPTAEDRLHVSQMDRRSKSTDSVCGASASENVAKKDNNGATSNEESISEPSNQRSKSCSTHFVQEKEAPAKRLWTYEKRAASSVTVRKDTPASPKESESRDPFDPFHRNRLSRRPQVLRTYKRTKPSSTEPIVLSSDDEGSDEVNDVSGSLREPQISEGIRDTQLGNLKSPKANARSERSTSKVEVPSIMELPFSTLHYGTVQAEANGTVVITDEGISIPLKGADGEGEVAISVACAQLQWYGVWDGGLAQDGSLLPSTDEPAPSLLFLSVLDAQARLLQKELSAIHTARMSGQACPFVLLVLDSQLEDRQTADLALLMDMIGLRYNQDTLSDSLSWADGLYRLHCHPQGVHFLALLGQDVKDAAQKTSEESSSGPSCLREPTVRRPLRSHTWQQNSRSPRRLIQYPPPPSKGGITVTTEDLECLNDGEFLNDVIIDFYLKYLLLERADKGVAERSHIFSSFFYKQLTRKDNSDPVETGKTAQYRRHQRVRTWTRHVDIFSKDYLFIPVNYEAHWYLVVICFPGLEHPQYVQWRDASQTSKESKPKAISSSAGECQTGSSQSKNNRLKSHNLPDCTVHSCTRETVCRRPCILVMDSLKLSYHQRIYTLLREYLQVEWEVRKGTPRDFTNQNISSSPCRVPQQDNSSDCGLYLLQYVESFLQNPVVHFDLPLRLEHWFPRNQVRRKREELRELVLQLYRRQGGGAEHNIK